MSERSGYELQQPAVYEHTPRRSFLVASFKHRPYRLTVRAEYRLLNKRAYKIFG